MKRPYLKKWGIVSGFTVWIVDGNYIRTNLDPEFTNFGQHYVFPRIPQDEFWIDREASPRKEIKYFIDHLLEENRLLRENKKFNYALLKADQLERAERRNSRIYKLLGDDVLKKIRTHQIKKYSKKVNVWIVDGELVRDVFFLDFTEGGHHYRYRFIPKKDVWIDNDISSRERKYVLLHELKERNLMVERLQRKNHPSPYKVYCWAHSQANKLESYCRHHPEEVDDLLKTELEKSE